MSLVGYSHGDLEQLEHPVGLDALAIEACSTQLRDFTDEQVAFYSRTLTREDRPIACFGIWPLGGRRGAAWSVLTEESLAVPKMLYAAVKASLNAFEANQGLTRIEAVGQVSNPALEGWFRHLGFRRETVDGGMRNYGRDGEAFHLWARCKRG